MQTTGSRQQSSSPRSRQMALPSRVKPRVVSLADKGILGIQLHCFDADECYEVAVRAGRVHERVAVFGTQEAAEAAVQDQVQQQRMRAKAKRMQEARENPAPHGKAVRRFVPTVDRQAGRQRALPIAAAAAVDPVHPGNQVNAGVTSSAVLRPAAADIPVRAVDMEDKYITIQQYKEEADALYQTGFNNLPESDEDWDYRTAPATRTTSGDGSEKSFDAEQYGDEEEAQSSGDDAETETDGDKGPEN